MLTRPDQKEEKKRGRSKKKKHKPRSPSLVNGERRGRKPKHESKDSSGVSELQGPDGKLKFYSSSSGNFFHT